MFPAGLPGAFVRAWVFFWVAVTVLAAALAIYNIANDCVLGYCP